MNNIPLNIDWQQILLHFFNFSILVGGLYLLLFKPVKRFMEKREQRDAAKAQADKILSDAKAAAESERQKIVAEANREAVAIAEDAMEKILAAQTAKAYDSFVNAAEEEHHEHD